MNVVDAIKERYSVRKYSSKEVTDDIIKELIEAARLAPSVYNTQPWFFKIIKNQKEKNVLKEKEVFPQGFVYKAPVLILCCADPSKYSLKESNLEPDDTNSMRAATDLAIAAQNLVLRATEIGLGTCYIGWMEKSKIKKIYNLPENYLAPYVIAVGYPEGERRQPSKKKIEEIML